MADEDKTKKPDENNQPSDDEWQQINKDIESAKSSLVSKGTEEQIKKAKEEAKKEAEKEMQTNQKIKELEENNKKLEEEKTQKEKEAAEKIEELRKKVDEQISSKAPVQNKDPFQEGKSKENDAKKGVDQWTDEEVKKYEEAHARAFFGDEQYERMLSSSK